MSYFLHNNVHVYFILPTKFTLNMDIDYKNLLNVSFVLIKHYISVIFSHYPNDCVSIYSVW